MTKEQEDSIYAIKFAVMQQQIDKLKKHNDELLRKLRNTQFSILNCVFFLILLKTY